MSATQSVPLVPPPLASSVPVAAGVAGGAYATAVGALNSAPLATPSETPATPTPDSERVVARRVEAGALSADDACVRPKCSSRTGNRARDGLTQRRREAGEQACQAQQRRRVRTCRRAATQHGAPHMDLHHGAVPPGTRPLCQTPRAMAPGGAMVRLGGRAPVCGSRFRPPFCFIELQPSSSPSPAAASHGYGQGDDAQRKGPRPQPQLRLLCVGGPEHQQGEQGPKHGRRCRGPPPAGLPTHTRGGGCGRAGRCHDGHHAGCVVLAAPHRRREQLLCAYHPA